MNYTDTVCECGHWFEEHHPEFGDCDACPTDSPCDTFTYSPEENAPWAIADRGSGPEDHAAGHADAGLPPCVCAMCTVFVA